MKKVLIITTSLRRNSNSEALALAFAEGARSAGNDVEVVSLKDKTLAFCKGCFACQNIGHCVIDDDANAIADKMEQAEVIVWATPVYYYGIQEGLFACNGDRERILYAGRHGEGRAGLGGLL